MVSNFYITKAVGEDSEALNFHHQSWLCMVTSTTRRTSECVMMGPCKCCKVEPVFQFSPSYERVRISWNSAEASSGNAAYIACLLLLCQGSKWLSGKMSE